MKGTVEIRSRVAGYLGKTEIELGPILIARTGRLVIKQRTDSGTTKAGISAGRTQQLLR
jgi:hypothetical protein